MPNYGIIIDSCTEDGLEAAAFEVSQHLLLSLEWRSQRSS